MALIDHIALRTELGISATEGKRDDVLKDLLSRAVSWVESQCNQPIDASSNTTYSFCLPLTSPRKVLPFRPVNELVSVETRLTPFDSWTTVTDAVLVEEDDVYFVAMRMAFSSGATYRATLKVGYTPTTLPGDLKQVLIEWIHLRYVENRETGDKRFGKVAAGDGKAGLNSSTTYDPEKLEKRWKEMLGPYRIATL